MRLVSAHIRGYGRIVDSEVNLDEKAIAIMGPNQASKTTLLAGTYRRRRSRAVWAV